MEKEAVNILGRIQENVEYLKSIENLLERLVASTDRMADSNNKMMKLLERSWQVYEEMNPRRDMQ